MAIEAPALRDTVYSFADSSEISTLNNGRIEEMIGKAMISANMNGEIGYQDKQTLILYSPQESAKRMNDYRQEKLSQETKQEENGESEIVEEVENDAKSIEDKIADNTQEEAPIQQEKKETKSSRKKSKQLKIDDIDQGEGEE